MGGKVIRCKGCGAKQYIYFSCGNAQCPICQGLKRMNWQQQLSDKLLDVPYVHSVFTLPAQLRPLSRRYPKVMYNLLMRIAWRTVKILSLMPENIGGIPGMVAVLHTFGSDMKYHPHVHCLITFGGWNDQGKHWCWPKRKRKFAAFRKICSTYRACFLKHLDKQIAKGTIHPGKHWKSTREELEKIRWNVNNSYPTMDTAIIENYLSRYINRIAISKNRLTYVKEQNQVQILYNDYKNQKKNQPAPKAIKYLHPLTAINQIMAHILPVYFQKSRYYGIHAPKTFKAIKDQIPTCLKRDHLSIRILFALLNYNLKLTPWTCESCNSTSFEIINIPANHQWIKQFFLGTFYRAPPLKPMSYFNP